MFCGVDKDAVRRDGKNDPTTSHWSFTLKLSPTHVTVLLNKYKSFATAGALVRVVVTVTTVLLVGDNVWLCKEMVKFEFVLRTVRDEKSRFDRFVMLNVTV